MKRFHRSMGPAGFIIAIFALVLALCGGTAVAASVITTKQIKNGAVTTPKIKDNAVTGAKVKDGSLTLSDLKASERNRIINVPVNTTVVQGPTVTVAPDDFQTITAYCPAGKKVTGGGYFSSITEVGASVPFNTTSWSVIIHNDSPISVDVHAYAVCA